MHRIFLDGSTRECDNGCLVGEKKAGDHGEKETYFSPVYYFVLLNWILCTYSEKLFWLRELIFIKTETFGIDELSEHKDSE